MRRLMRLRFSSFLFVRFILTVAFTAVILTACDSGSSDKSKTSNSKASGLPDDINGLIVMDTWSNLSNNYKGIYEIDFDDGQVKKHRQLTTAAKGIYPYAHDRQTITYAEKCGGRSNFRIKTITEKGLSSKPLLSCIKNDRGFMARLHVTKFSPDKSKLAVEVMFSDREYGVIVFDVKTAKPISRYKDFNSPEWHPDGRLFLSTTDLNLNKGVYSVNADSSDQPTRIDPEIINQSVSYLNISPSGKKLTFSMSSQIWMVDIGSKYALSNLHEVINEGASLETATWSPDGEYIAYLSYSHGKGAQKITFFNVDTEKTYIFDTRMVLPLGTNGTHWLAPRGYLSWVK